MKSWSVGGIHPTEGDLAYAACQCFSSPEDARQWQAAARSVYGNVWWLADVLEDRELPDSITLPPVAVMIERLHATARTSGAKL